MRTLNEFFAPRLDIADISTVASLDYAVMPDTGNIVQVYTSLKATISGADGTVYIWKGGPLRISVAADAGGGDVTFTVPAHGLRVGDYVYHHNCNDGTNYDGLFAVTAVPSETTYSVTATWNATEAQGTALRVVGNAGTTGDGKIVIAYSGSLPGDIDTAIPSGATKRVSKGDLIGAVAGGTSTTAAGLQVTVVVDR